MKIYKKYSKSGRLLIVARIVCMHIGKYSFETSLLGLKPFELNINMPMFDTEAEAMQWIENNPEWQSCGRTKRKGQGENL